MASAATLTVTDDNGKQAPVELQSNDYLRLTATPDGDMFLEIRGFAVSLDDGSGATSGDGGSTGADGSGTGGDGGSSGGDGGSTGGDVGSTGGDGGSTGGDGGSTGGDGGNTGGDGGSTGGDGGSTGGDQTDSTNYCAGNDENFADCKAEQNFDPWIASTGEKPYWIRNRLTEVFPFTLPSREDAASIRYGYLHLTTGERKRETASEDIFHVWFSETPNGPVLEGNSCEWYGAQAKTSFYWTQDSALGREMCDLGTESRVMYLNFETRCYAKYYRGTCDDDNRRKSSAKYQFDVSRRLRSY